jgi:ArsR family transcriptional regulator
VSARRQGNSVTYSIGSPHIAELLAVARTVLSGLLNEQVDALERSAIEAP